MCGLTLCRNWVRVAAGELFYFILNEAYFAMLLDTFMPYGVEAQ